MALMYYGFGYNFNGGNNGNVIVIGIICAVFLLIDIIIRRKGD